MSDETKEAVRLLVECMDELQLHDQDYQYTTSERLKVKLRRFFTKHGITTASDAAAALVSTVEPVPHGECPAPQAQQCP